MARYFFLWLILSFACQASALAINVEDPALEKCIQEAMQKESITAIQDLNKLRCHSQDIESVVGIDELSGLEYLSLFANDIQEADLRSLKQLTYLNLAKNKLTTLKIAHLNRLETVFLFNNKLRTLDMSGLSSLKKFRIMQNQLKVLDLSDALLLEEIYLWDNQLEDLDITGLNHLSFMDVKQNPMPDELYDFFDEQEGIVISHDGNADDWK